MLSECTNRINELKKKPEARSPYFIQYKIFEDRLKNQGLKWKNGKFKNKKEENVTVNVVGESKEDYLKLVRKMLMKN